LKGRGEILPRLLKREEYKDPASSERLYYKIGEISRITGLRPHVLRYWESEFKMIKPYKGGSLQRLYRKKDLDLILKIKKLLYEEGFTIAGAKKKIRDQEKGESKQTKVGLAEKGSNGKDHELLIIIRDELNRIREMLE
jgi:DNA-binding transcriptional MerR regulator